MLSVLHNMRLVGLAAISAFQPHGTVRVYSVILKDAHLNFKIYAYGILDLETKSLSSG